MGRLDSEMIESRAPDGVSTARYNHEDCPAGVDTRRRLYITRKDDGVIVGYCHNCGGSGVALRGRTTYRRESTATAVTVQVQEIAMPANLEFDPISWPTKAQEWVNKAGIPLTTVREYALAWDLDASRVVIPKYNLDNELVMYQSRNVGLCEGPKYITERLEGADIHTPMGISTPPHLEGGVVVLVEDMMSAIKITLTGWDAIPLFSSNVKIDKLLTNVDKYGTIIVWLDNDGTEVKRHRDSMARQLRSIGKRVEVVKSLSDPKHYELDDIVEEIQDQLIKF